MGHDFNLTNDEIENFNKEKNSLLKAPISFNGNDIDLPIDSDFKFVPKEIKKNKKIGVTIIDIKNNKNKSKKLL